MSGVSRAPSASTDCLRSKSQYLEHPRRLDDAAQLQLAPLTADVRRPQRLHEPAGLDLECVLSRAQRAQLLGQRRVRADPVALDLGQLRVDLAE